MLLRTRREKTGMTIEKAYDSWAKTYDSIENKTRDLEKTAALNTLDQLEFDHVLELGCGTGKNTEWLCKKSKNLIGLDFSNEMLAIARAKVSPEKAQLKQANLLNAWEVENNWADLITCSLVLEHIEDIGPIFKQAHEKLKHNGHLFICELHPFKQYQGSKARFEQEGKLQELEVHLHHLSDYTQAFIQTGFELVELKEWFDDADRSQVPRLLSLLLKK